MRILFVFFSEKDNRTIRYTGVWSLFLGDGLGYWSGPRFCMDQSTSLADRFNFTEKKTRENSVLKIMLWRIFTQKSSPIGRIGIELELSETLKLSFHEFFSVKLNLFGGPWGPPERYFGPCIILDQTSSPTGETEIRRQTKIRKQTKTWVPLMFS